MKLNLPEDREFTGPSLLWKRVMAFLIDMLAVNFFVLIPFKPFFSELFPSDYSFSQMYAYLNSNPHFISRITIVSVFMSFMVILYFISFEAKFRQSIGKKLMNLHVRSQSNELKLWQHFIRNILFLPIFPFILLWVLDPLFMFFSKSKQTLTEILSKTEVVQKYNF